MWLSAALLLTIVLTLREVLGQCGLPSTGGIQQLAYNTSHKQGATKLLKLLSKYLLLVTFENGEMYSIRFKISVNFLHCWNDILPVESTATTVLKILLLFGVHLTWTNFGQMSD